MSKIEIEMTAAVDDAVKGIRRVDDALGGMADAGKKTGLSLTDLKSGVDLAGQALQAFAGVFQQAFDFGKRGAQVQQTADSFDGLIVKVGASRDLLDQLRSASSGTIDDLKLMSATTTLLAGAQGSLATELANATPQLLEIAKAANKLNPSLGDTAFLYESIATGVKRASPMILDNLGLTIKIGDANAEYAAALGKTAEQLTAEEQKQALLNATLEAGATLIEQAGGSAGSATDSFARLEAATKNLSDAVAADLAPQLANAAEAAATLLTWNDTLNEATMSHAAQVAATAQTYADYEAELRRAALAAGLTVTAEGELVRVTMTASGARFELLDATYLLSQAEFEWSGITDRAADGNRDLAAATGESATAAETATQSVTNYGAEADAATRALARLQGQQAGWVTQTGNEVTAALRAAGVEGQAYKDALAAIDFVTGGSLAQEEAHKTKLAELATQYGAGKLTLDEYRAALANIYALDAPETQAALATTGTSAAELDDKLKQAAAQGIGTAKTALGELGEQAGTKLPASVLLAEKQIDGFGKLLKEQNAPDGQVTAYIIGLSQIEAAAMRVGGAIRSIPPLPGAGGSQLPITPGSGDYEKRAGGGPVAAGVPYIVGEQGMELFVPRTSGNIVPNDKLGAGGNRINIGQITIVSDDPAAMFEAIQHEAKARGYQFAAVA